MMRLEQTIRNNIPSRKPQLWEDPVFALKRRVLYAVMSGLRRRWLDLPHVVRLRRFPLLMEVVPRFSIDRAIFLYGIYEISCTRFVERFLQPGMTFLDVGAATGYYSLLASHLVGPSGRVYAFEPHQGLRDRFERNVAINSLRNIVLRPEAVAAHDGVAEFFETRDETNYGTSSLVPRPQSVAHRSVVPCVTLDRFVRRLPTWRVHLIKIDVEGAEMAVLEGARRLLSAPDGPGILFESFDVGPPANLLGEFGYSVRYVQYSLKSGLTFSEVGAPFDNPLAAYEAPNYVALKTNGDTSSFERLAGTRVLALPVGRAARCRDTSWT